MRLDVGPRLAGQGPQRAPILAPLRFEGRAYRFDLMTPFFDPGPIERPRIPIYLAGVNPHKCRIAGEVADGLHIHSFHSARYLRECVHPAVQEGLNRSGRSRANFTFRASTMVVLGDTAEDRRGHARAVKQQIAFYASTRTYQAVLAALDRTQLYPSFQPSLDDPRWPGVLAARPSAPDRCATIRPREEI